MYFRNPFLELLKLNIISNSLPNKKILDLSKLKTLADDKKELAEMMIFVFDKVENIVGKEKMLETSISAFYNNVFEKFFFTKSH